MIDGHYESFVVRLWVRGGEIARGEVSRTVSGETERFVDLHALSRFLVESVALAGSRSSDSRGDHPAENGDAAHGPNERVVELRRGRARNEVASDD